MSDDAPQKLIDISKELTSTQFITLLCKMIINGDLKCTSLLMHIIWKFSDMRVEIVSIAIFKNGLKILQSLWEFISIFSLQNKMDSSRIGVDIVSGK